MAILPVQVCGIRIAHSSTQLAASQGLPETLTGLRQSSIYFYPEGFARRVRRVLADRMKLRPRANSPRTVFREGSPVKDQKIQQCDLGPRDLLRPLFFQARARYLAGGPAQRGSSVLIAR